MHRPASPGRPRFDIADIVRLHRAALEAEEVLTPGQRQVLSAIERCRTAALGGHLERCRSCNFEQPAYNSCRNRHCPKCQALAQEKWIRARAERLLPVRHFHVVFTLPSELRRLARWKPKLIFDALFHAASATLLELGRSRLKAELGITMVLHTWTRDLRFHPHVHSIVTAGGLNATSETWVDSKASYLFPVKVMGTLLQGKMTDALRSMHARGDLDGFDEFEDPEAFEKLMTVLGRQSWIVYAKQPFRRSKHVLHYLGRYTHRVGIANSRLLDVTADHVTFRTKNGLATTVDPVEFLRRLILHVLPTAFVKIRHYGLLASSCLAKLEFTRRLLASQESNSSEPILPSWREVVASITHRCPYCSEYLECIALPLSARGPPRPTR